MKKILCLLLAACLLLPSGCASPEDSLPESFAVGIIQTVGNKDDSRILYYDEHLEQTGVSHYPYATMGSVFYTPPVFDGGVYVVPQGPANKKDLSFVLRLDLKDFGQTRFDAGQPAINGACADGDAVFAVNTLNGDSVISRISREDGAVRVKTFPGVYISFLALFQDTLFAFSTGKGASGLESALLCLSPDSLEEIRRLDTTALGNSVYSAEGYRDVLYFAPSATGEDKPNHLLGTYNLADGALGSVELDEAAWHLLRIEDTLFVSHGNLVTGEGSALSAVNLDTLDTVTHSLDLFPVQMACHNRSLYLLGKDRVAKYAPETMEKLAEAAVAPKDGYYLSGVFPGA